jgi:hypothetical protein
MANTKVVYLIAETGSGNTKKSFWNRVGVVFDENQDGSRNMRLDMFPDVRFQIREPKEKEDEPGQR